jgi:glycosyltransferase involved in cell wall biosynthesis
MPAYNEEKRIGATLEAYGRFFNNLKKEKKLDYEILVVINNTKDKTEEVVKKFQRKNKNIRFLNFKQGGKGFAIIEGFKDSLRRKNDMIGFVDADMATPPESLYRLVLNINNFDGVMASRWIKGSIVRGRTLKKRIFSSGFNFIVRSLFMFNYRDTQCGAKLFKKHLIEKILPELNLTQWAFDVNLLYSCRKHGFIIKEVPTVWQDQKESKIKPSTPVQMFAGVVRLRAINSPFEPLLRPLKPFAGFMDLLINRR